MRKPKQPTRRIASPSRQAAQSGLVPAKRQNTRREGWYNFYVAALTFTVGTVIATYLFFTNPYLKPFESYWLVNAIVLVWIPLSVIILCFKYGPADFGMSAGDKSYGLKFTAVAILFMLPIVFYASQMEGFRETYGGRLTQSFDWLGTPESPCRIDLEHPIFNSVTNKLTGYPLVLNSGPALIFYELGMGFYLFCWEFFYRGFLLFGLARARFIGNVGAVILQTIPFTLLHWSIVASAAKPAPEIISAFFGGLILGALAIKTRSFFWGFLIHWVIAIAMDAFVIAPQLFKF